MLSKDLHLVEYIDKKALTDEVLYSYLSISLLKGDENPFVY